MSHSAIEFEFLDDGAEGQLVQVGGSIAQLRALLAKGEIDTAVKLYEETAGSVRKALLDEVLTGSFELKKNIAQLFRRARDFAAAGLIYEGLKLDAEAAPCFEQASDFLRAAGAWKRAGELTRAALAFDRAGRIDDAIALYTQTGAREQLAECLVRAGRHAQAADLYRALGNLHGEVESLRACVAASPQLVKPNLRLAQLLFENGHAEKAIALLMACARSGPPGRDDPSLLSYLAGLFEATNNPEAATKVRARIPAAAPTEPRPVPVLQTVQPLALGGDAYGFLKALPFFADLSMEDMRAVFRICVHHSFKAGTHVIEPGEPGRGLFIIIEGQVEVFDGSGKDARLLNTMGPGSAVGEISLLLDGPTSARVTARTNARALFIGREGFRQFMSTTPSAAVRIYRLFSTTLAERVRTLSAAR
jgi:tetratricopeptide (TPR) repeat protein